MICSMIFIFQEFGSVVSLAETLLPIAFYVILMKLYNNCFFSSLLNIMNNCFKFVYIALFI